MPFAYKCTHNGRLLVQFEEQSGTDGEPTLSVVYRDASLGAREYEELLGTALNRWLHGVGDPPDDWFSSVPAQPA